MEKLKIVVEDGIITEVLSSIPVDVELIYIDKFAIDYTANTKYRDDLYEDSAYTSQQKNMHSYDGLLATQTLCCQEKDTE